MARLITGILAHVDAGKTTLSEALLFRSGAIRSMGRVDKGNSFLDNSSIERRRGITIFSKEARLGDSITLIDTPGHIDFCAEMERTLCVLDAAILIIDATQGIQAHTRTLWALLRRHLVPTLIFVNKTDSPLSNTSRILSEIKSSLSCSAIDFTTCDGFETSEDLASLDEKLLEKYLDGQEISQKDISCAVCRCSVFPVLFGSALKLEGIDRLLSVLGSFFTPHPVSDEFGAVVYKISTDRQGNRLSHIKVTGGVLSAKDNLGEEKANEVRIYSGDKYESVKSVDAGNVCTVTGLRLSRPGTVYGNCCVSASPTMESALIYSVIMPDGADFSSYLKALRSLEEELPELKVSLSQKGEILVMLMGEVQAEVVTELMKSSYGLDISFGEGKIAYRETIASSVLGIGHYEPLKHYAEVHLRLKPLERGSGMVFRSELPVNELELNWQRLILTHMKEKTHPGVLTGSPLTDMEISLVAGKSHLKHTEGGDFRQATYRAIRQALMKASSILLEPVYSYELFVPASCTGRAMSDIDRMKGTFTLETDTSGMSRLYGLCPVSTMMNYIKEVRTYTRGQGNLTVMVSGYAVCHNTDEVVSSIGYDPEHDMDNPSSSVFCSHGAGHTVPWNEVDSMRHIK